MDAEVEDIQPIEHHSPDTDDGAARTSRLLSLPAEVRNLIFSFVLTQQHIHLRWNKQPALHWSLPRDGHVYHHALERDRPPPSPTEKALLAPAASRAGQLAPLWRVCRQLYAETLHVPFSRANVFSFADRDALAMFVARASPQQLDGIRNIWVTDDSQSAMCMELLAGRLAAADLQTPLCDMTIYIYSRMKRLELAASDLHSERSRFAWTTLRAGSDLSYEKRMVNGLRGLWERLVKEVIVREV